MFAKFRLYIVFAVLITVFSLGAYATDIIYPDSSSGEYTYTYETGIANDEFAVFVVRGLLDEGETPVISIDSVIYYNVFNSDNTGKLDITFIPSVYTDATLVLAGHGQTSPVILCHVMKDTAKDVEDFSFELSRNSVIVDGTSSASIQFAVQAYDSFGFDTVLPEYTTYEIVGYTGTRVTASKNGIIVGATAEAGEYTVRISCGDVIREKTFTVERSLSLPASVTVSVDGNAWYTHYIECMNTVDGFTFSPSSLEITTVTYDQYGDVIFENYTFKAVQLDENDNPVTSSVIATGEATQFVPQIQTFPGETLSYEIEVVSVSKPTLKASVLIIVEGKTGYAGDALELYDKYLEAKEYISLVEQEEIQISVDGKDVYYEYSWVTQDKYSALETAIQTASDVLSQIDSGVTDSTAVNESYNALKAAVLAFSRALKKGLLAPIEDIYFENASVNIAMGTNTKLKVSVLPQKPSESVVYSSSNTDIVTVSSAGIIVAKAQGDAVITASNPDGSIYDECQVHVFKQILEISWKKRNIELVAGESVTPELNISPSDHSDELAFSSSDENVVTVDGNGVVTATGVGNAKITVQTIAGKKAIFDVKVTQPAFGGIDSIRGKPQGSFKLPVTFERSKSIAKLQVKATFDKDIFTFTGTQDSAVLSGYEGTDTSEEGTAIAVWNIGQTTTDLSGELAKFAFTVAENAPYETYRIRFDISAFTSDDDQIICENGSFETKIVVGESNTYSITAQAESNGSVTGTAQYEYGARATVSATPDNLYVFDGWYSNGQKVSTDKTYTFIVTQDITLVAKFSKQPPVILGGNSSSSDDSDDEEERIYTVSPVTANILSGSHVEYGSSLVLTSATPGAMIYYTLDGSTPSAAATRYTEPIIIDSNMTVMAVAVKGGMLGSNIATFIYTVATTDTVSITLKQNAASVKYITPENSRVRPDDAATRYEVIEMLNKLFDVKGRIVASVGFIDWIPKYKNMIDKYAGAGIINGYPDRTFRGTSGITRAETAKILCMMLGFDMSKANTYNTALNDIAGHWAHDYIKVCATMGLVKGYPDGSFKPENLVTRAEIITILNRITGISKVSGLTTNITDLNIGHWAYDDIVNIIDLQITG